MKMTNLLLAAVTTFTFAANAQTVTTVNPNVFKCSFDKYDVETNLVVDMRDARPSMILERATSSDVKDIAKLGSTSVDKTSVGRIVSGFYPYIADANQVFGVVLPKITLASTSSELAFNTIILEQFEGTFFPFPLPNQDTVRGRTTSFEASCVAEYQEAKYQNVSAHYSRNLMPMPGPIMPPRSGTLTVRFDALSACSTEDFYKVSLGLDGYQEVMIEQVKEDTCKKIPEMKTFSKTISAYGYDSTRDLYFQNNKVTVTEYVLH